MKKPLFKSVVSQSVSVLLLLSILVVLTLQPAYAYLDAGTGSMLIQALIASFLASLMALKLFWGRVVMTFKTVVLRKKLKESSKTSSQQQDKPSLDPFETPAASSSKKME
jgi:hypothetical protein